MKMIRTYSLMVLSVGMLTACGEGYEMVRTTDTVPYGNSRTAGSGVMYVKKSMLPEKKLNLKPQSVPSVKAKTPSSEKGEEKIINKIKDDMEKLFESKLKK